MKTLNLRQVVTATLVFSLAFSTLPVLAETPGGETVVPADPSNQVSPAVASPIFRASVDRAYAAAGSLTLPEGILIPSAPQRPSMLPEQFARPSHSEEQVVSSGGGGKMHAMTMVITLVSTIGGLAATYYMVKAMKKQTSAINSATGQ